MITDITNYITEHILTWSDISGDCPISEDPGIEYDLGIHLAYKHPIKGVLTKMTDESEYTGIDDRRGNFFYIRHVDDEQLPYTPPERLVASCLKSVIISVPLRLVSVIQGIEQPTGNERYSIEEFLRNALLNIDFTNYIGIEKNIEIELTLGRVNSPQVLAEERVEGAEPRGFGLDNVFVAIDFTLKYTFNVETKGIPITKYCDWFLPSKDELAAMYTNLHAEGVGDFSDLDYWSSTESSATGAYAIDFGFDESAAESSKDTTYHVRACRSFTAEEGDYSLGDTGPAGGLIFYVDGTTYYEAAPEDQSASQAWSNIINVEIGVTAQGTAIGTGQANTDAIIAQAGHVDSAALLCDNLCVTISESGSFLPDTPGGHFHYD